MLVLAMIAGAPSAAPQSLFCQSWFSDGSRHGIMSLQLSGDHKPFAMNLTLNEADGWTRAQVELDPKDRKLPGQLKSVFFAVRFTRKPAYPLKLAAFADGQLRWRKTILVPFWPTILPTGKAMRNVGTVDYVAQADDGLPVQTPRELKVVLTDAKGRVAGDLRYPLIAGATEEALTKSLAEVQTRLDTHQCFPPPPPID